MKPEIRNRIVFLLDKITKINETTEYKAVLRVDHDGLDVYVDDKDGESVMISIINDLTEEKTYEVYMKLDAITDTTGEE